MNLLAHENLVLIVLIKTNEVKADECAMTLKALRTISCQINTLFLTPKTIYHLHTAGYWLVKKVHLILLSAGWLCPTVLQTPFPLLYGIFQRERMRDRNTNIDWVDICVQHLHSIGNGDLIWWTSHVSNALGELSPLIPSVIFMWFIFCVGVCL